MTRLSRVLRKLLIFFFGSAIVGVIVAAGVYFYIAPGLPSVDVLKNVQLQVPLRVFSSDGKLIAEYGEKKRTPLRYDQIPPIMIKAVLAAEDDNFFHHPGVDLKGLVRAAVHLIETGKKEQGGSTITMQVARNFFLSRQKTYLRKIREIILALRIEHALTKREILELYLNKIYLGHRAYGVAAAAQVYYGKEIHKLDLAQIAMIAGLPQAPSAYNPLANPKYAIMRRNYVLGRMRALGDITQAQYEKAHSAPVSAIPDVPTVQLDAPYVAEMVRSMMVDQYGPAAYTQGLDVYTTINSHLQQAANQALRHGLIDYDMRHGYRGPEGHVDLKQPVDAGEITQALADYAVVGGLVPAVVVKEQDQSVQAITNDGRTVTVPWSGLSWARPYIDVNRRGPAPKTASDILKVGDIIRLEPLADDQWRLSEIPQVSGALVSLRPKDGAIRALVGGFDYFHSKFNRAIQAQRQPGSNFKPFVYSAALHHGFTPATVINDAPVVFKDPGLENTWRPENYSGKFFGPTRLREGLVHSINLVSIRILQAIGINYAINYVQRFGFDPARLPHNLSLALGSATLTPLEIARGYATFANGGFLIHPYLVERITGAEGQPIAQAEPPVACPECDTASTPVVAKPDPGTSMLGQPINVQNNAPPPGTTAADTTQGAVQQVAATPPAQNVAPRVLSPQNDYLMTTMMEDVIRHGTGRGALSLHRQDLAGKTGTTNKQRDAWFSGFDPSVETTVWVGFDTPKTLGHWETGARAALPIWRAYMKAALAGVPDLPYTQPPGIVTARIDSKTGKFANSDDPNAIFEVFRSKNVPKPSAATPTGNDSGGGSGNSSGVPVTEQLF